MKITDCLYCDGENRKCEYYCIDTDFICVTYKKIDDDLGKIIKGNFDKLNFPDLVKIVLDGDEHV